MRPKPGPLPHASERTRRLAGVLLLALGALLAAAPLLAADAPQGAAGGAPFPRPLDSYGAEEGMTVGALLAARVKAEPLNLAATVFFLLAVVHTFLAPRFLHASHALRDRREARGADGHSFGVEALHLLGEVEAVFGFWVVPLLATIAVLKGPATVDAYVARGVNFTEPLFVVVIMAISSTRPVLGFAERCMGAVARLGKGTPLAWWLTVLTVGPLLGSFITEPAAMIICAILLGRRFFELDPSPRLRYGTLGLLFVNISVGGTLTHFAAPPVLMVASKYGWGFGFMLTHFGWKAVVGILVSSLAYAALFRRELVALGAKAAAQKDHAPETRVSEKAVPAWITVVHLLFLGFTVVTAHTPALFIGGFLFFLAFQQATAPHQHPLNLRPALLVGFFLAGLVIHGTLQQWWIAPLLARFGEGTLFLGSMALTAFNDNAAITYLASLVPGFTEGMKYAVVAGAVTGGGLTVIANAPNPAGQATLARYFPDGVSPLRLLLGAALPTVVMAAAFRLF